MAELTGLPPIFLFILKRLSQLLLTQIIMTWQKMPVKMEKKWTILNMYGTRINKTWHLRLWLGRGREGHAYRRNL